MRFFLALAWLLAIASSAAAANRNSDFDEFRYVSSLRVSLRTVEKPQQCLLFWKGLSEKMEEETTYRRPDSGVADNEMLAGLVRRLKAKTVYLKLAAFVEECNEVLRRLPPEAFAQFARKGARAFEEDLDIPTMKKRIAQLGERLKEVEAERDAALDKIAKMKREPACAQALENM